MTDPFTQPPPEAAPAPHEPQPASDTVPWTIPDTIWVYLLWWLVLIGLSLALRPLFRVVFPGADLEAYSLPITLFLLFGVTWLYVRRFGSESRKLFGTRSPSWSAAGWALLAGVIATVISFGLGRGIEELVRALDGQIPPVQEEFQRMAADESLSLLLVISSVVFAPIAEETFFRGMLFPALRQRLGVWPGIGLSALAFSITHIQTTLSGVLLVMLLLMPLSMLLAWLYNRFGTLLAPIVTHATFNLINVLLLMNQAQSQV